MKFKSLLTLGLLAAATSAGAANAIPLASWTFDKAYTATDLEAPNKLYTPTEAEATDVTGWFNSEVPHFLPNEAAIEGAELSAMSDRYWQLCGGYNNRVLRVVNNDAIAVTDFTNPDQHKVYYQISFPTKGYKGIAVDYSLASGNNKATPIEMVVSTDGGATWFDAGAVETESTWWTYKDVSVNISANNKENVLVRLLPKEDATNWNLLYVKVSAEEAVQEEGPVSLTDMTLAWPYNQGTDSSLGAEGEQVGLFSIASLSPGAGLTISGPRDGETLLQPSENQSERVDALALTFTVRAKKGLEYTPKKFTFKTTRYGTDGGNLDIVAEAAGKTAVLADVKPPRNNADPNYLYVDVDLTPLGNIGSEIMTVKVYVRNLGSNKQVGVGDVKLVGDLAGTVEAVPVYTLSVDKNIEDAGNVTVSPVGNEFDEGTEITVKASENFGYHFQGWNDAEGNLVSEANPYVFALNANTALTAVYTKNNVYALNLALEGGANVNLVEYLPEGNVVDGIHYYEEGTDVRLTAKNNQILTFTNWSDNTTSPTLDIKMDGEKNITATFSAVDYIVGWDFYNDQPAGERAADYKDESDNAGMLSLHNAEGKTSTWLSRGHVNGDENGRYGARIWKLRSEGLYFEISFSSVGYSNLKLLASLGCSYNTYSENNAEYSIDGVNYHKIGTYNITGRGWFDGEFALPAEADNQARVWIRFMPNRESALVGNETDYDGLAITDVFVLADKAASSDDVAPVLVSTIPANGSEGASATGSIVLTFDEKVKAGTGNATLGDKTLTPRESGKSIVYNYAGLAYGTEYTFTVPAGAVVDRSGNAFAGTTLTFKTMERAQPEARLYDAIVAADGSGDYTSVQAAIDAAPEGRINPWLIFVKNGNYKEHIDIPAKKPFIHIIGQDRDKAVILDDKLCGGDNAVHVSVGATVVINANDCLFENITLENSWGHEKQAGPQALALNTSGDRAIFNNVAMLSYQDTWITSSNSKYRAYVRNSLIEGAVDFIYNSGDIYVDNTTLYINRKSGGYIVAPSHATDVAWGYVFNNCKITAPGNPTETDVWLGRPWHNFPKTVYLNTRAEVTIPAAGWYETMGGLPVLWADWNTTDINGNPVDLSQRRHTYYRTENGEKIYGEAKNFLTDEEAAEYTVENVLSGSDNWNPVLKTEECAAPVVTFADGNFSWEAVPYAICYVVTDGENVVKITTDTAVDGLDASKEYFVQAVNENGGLSAKTSSTKSGLLDAAVEGLWRVEGIYDLQGRRLAAPAPGVNIVRSVDQYGNVRVQKLIEK